LVYKFAENFGVKGYYESGGNDIEFNRFKCSKSNKPG